MVAYNAADEANVIRRQQGLPAIADSLLHTNIYLGQVLPGQPLDNPGVQGMDSLHNGDGIRPQLNRARLGKRAVVRKIKNRQVAGAMVHQAQQAVV